MLILWYRVKSRLAHFHPCLYPLVVDLRTYNHDMTMSVVGRHVLATDSGYQASDAFKRGRRALNQ